MTEDRARSRRGRRAWIPSVIADRYETERELGAGAAAVTVAAHDRRLDRRVAIKILKPESERDPEFSRRFTREARAAAAINHPNVVSVYDVGQEGDLLYLVMQYVDGTDLKRLIERNGALPWRRAVEIARDVLAGLAPIHDAGIVHRDIKPQNVLIAGDGSVKVTDFGVAHMELDAALTTAGTTVGTASYMAPEQAQGQSPTPAADVYAVGVMLYEMVSGGLPFNEPTSIATMLAHIQQEAEPPVAPRGMEAIPEGLELVIRQAMAKRPDTRFRTATAMRRALEDPDTFADDTGSAAMGPTEVVPAVRRSAARPRAQASSPARPAPSYAPVGEEKRGGGFGATFVVILLVLALALVAVAGTLWVMEDRPDLLAGGGSDDPTATVSVPTPTPVEATEAPAVIEPVDQETEPAPTPTPTTAPEPTDAPTPTPTPSPEPPTPTEQVIVPVGPTDTPAVDQSTDGQEPQIIEPIQPTEPPS